MSKHGQRPWLYRGKSDSVHERCDTHPYGRQIFRFVEDEAPSDADLNVILAAPDLLEALESVEREHELLRWMKNCESKRDRGSFGIAVMSDEPALEWRSHNASLEMLVDARRAAIARAKGEAE